MMDPMTLGLTLAVLEMGGTLLTLYVLSLLAELLKRLFPLEAERPSDPPSSAKGETPSSQPSPRGRGGSPPPLPLEGA